MYAWQKLKTINSYLIKIATDFQWQPNYLHPHFLHPWQVVQAIGESILLRCLWRVAYQINALSINTSVVSFLYLTLFGHCKHGGCIGQVAGKKNKYEANQKTTENNCFVKS